MTGREHTAAEVLAGPRARRARALSHGRMAAWAAAIAAALAGTGSEARGQGFDLDPFKPAATGTGYICEESARTLPRGAVEVATALGYSFRPLVVRDQQNGGIEGDIVALRWSAYVTASYGLLDRVDVGARLPVVLAQGGRVAVDLSGTGGVPRHPAAPALGDLDLLARVRLAGPAGAHGLRLTLTAPLGLPVGDPDALTGTGRVSFRPRLIGGWDGPRLSLAISAGYEFRRKTEVPGSTYVVGRAVGVGAGFALVAVPGPLGFLDTLTVLAEASASLGLAQPETGLPATPTQAMVGARARVGRGFWIQAAVGTGLNGAVGSPRFRALLTVAHTWDAPVATGPGSPPLGSSAAP